MFKRFGLIGKKLGHSFSRKYFTEKFKALTLDYEYELIEIQDISEIQTYLKDSKYFGFNVTIPYKSEILKYVNVSKEIEGIGAANVLHKSENEWFAANTDVKGFQYSLESWLTILPSRTLIIGNGGASKAVQCALQNLAFPYDIVARNPQNQELNLLEIKDFSKWELIIQTTPVGMFPDIDVCLDLPFYSLDSSHFVYDLIYNPLKTKFLSLAKNQGAKIKNGLEMLQIQAEEAWKIWENNISN